jgi:hypothetical protein
MGVIHITTVLILILLIMIITIISDYCYNIHTQDQMWKIKVKVKLSLYTHHEGVWDGITSGLDWLLYPRGKSPWHPLNRRLGGLQGLSGNFREKKNLLPLLGIKPCFLHHIAHSLITIQTMLYRSLEFYMCKTKIIILLSWLLICLP